MYEVLVADDYHPSADEAVTALEGLVNERLQEGWELQGGVSLAYDNETNSYSAAQAVVKKRK